MHSHAGAMGTSKEEKNKIIYKASPDGFSQHKLAIIVGVSQTQIGSILKLEKV